MHVRRFAFNTKTYVQKLVEFFIAKMIQKVYVSFDQTKNISATKLISFFVNDKVRRRRE